MTTPHQPDGGPASCKYEPGVWYGWNGGEMPVHPETEVKWVADGGWHGVSLGKQLDWSDNLVAFMIIREYREPREWWIHPQGLTHSRSSTPRKGWIHVREVIDGEAA